MDLLLPLMAAPIGDYAAVPFPAPVWLMQTLLVAGFFLHALPMNVSLMGGLFAAALLWWGKATQHPHAERAGQSLAKSLPLFTTMTITNGIVPLLFLQVLYGPVVLTSSIIMAVPWISILFLLAAGYYALYIYAYKKEWFGARSPWVLIASSLLFLVIAFFFTNNMTLMLTPDKFVPMVANSPNGLNLNLGEPSLIPRYLHFVLAATAVTSLVLGCFGWYQAKCDEAYSQWLIQTSASVFLAITLVQIGVGSWFLFSLPPAMTAAFLGGKNLAFHPFLLAMVLDVIALIAMSLAAFKKSVGAFKVGFFAALGIVAAMIFSRHALRLMMLDGLVNPNLHAVEPQWPVLAIFGGMVVATAIFFTWLAKVTWQAFHPENGTAVAKW